MQIIVTLWHYSNSLSSYRFRYLKVSIFKNVMMYTRYDRTQYVSFSPKIVSSKSFNLVERRTIPCSFREAFYGIFYGVQ